MSATTTARAQLRILANFWRIEDVKHGDAYAMLSFINSYLRLRAEQGSKEHADCLEMLARLVEDFQTH